MSEELQKVLENFCRLEGVRCAILLNANGQMAGSHAEKTSVPLPQIEAMATHCLQLGKDIGASLQHEMVTHSYLEFLDYSMVAEVLDSKATLVIVTDPETNLGRLRLEIKKNRKVVDALV